MLIRSDESPSAQPRTGYDNRKGPELLQGAFRLN
jgi:hypothetical protein